jgi:hypothetical protein
MSTDERPFNYWIVWEDKPALRAIYLTYYEEIRARCRPGQTLEIGGGSGNLMNPHSPDEGAILSALATIEG